MGKGSTPTPPTPPTAQEVAAANVETAGHLARLHRAMEFGEEHLKHKTNEDGSSVRYERVSTDMPEGYRPVYSDTEISSSIPTSLSLGRNSVTGAKAGFGAGGRRTVGINSAGQIEEEVGLLGGVTYPAGTDWAEIDLSLWPENDFPIMEGSQPFTSKVRTLTGFESPTGERVTANQYFKIDTAPDGKLISRVVVPREEAIDVDFTGMGDIDRALKRWEFEKETSPEVADHLLRMAREKGLAPDGFIDTAVEMIKRSDETGYAVRELAGKLASEYEPGELPSLPQLEELAGPELMERVGVAPTLPEVDFGDVPEYERAAAFGDLERLGATPTLTEMDVAAAPEFGRLGEMAALERAEAAPTLERLTDIPDVPLDAESMAAREFAEEELLRRAQSGETSRLMGEEARRIARGRAAGLGNIFGGGAAIEEAAAVRQAEDAGQRAAISDLLNFYGSGQTAGD